MEKQIAAKIVDFWSGFLSKKYLRQDAGDREATLAGTIMRSSARMMSESEIELFRSNLQSELKQLEGSVNLSIDYDPDDRFWDILDRCHPKAKDLLPIKTTIDWCDRDKILQASVGYSGEWHVLEL